MSPCELTTFITAVANIAATEKNSSEVAILAAMFVQLGDTLATIAVLMEENEPPAKQNGSL